MDIELMGYLISMASVVGAPFLLTKYFAHQAMKRIGAERREEEIRNLTRSYVDLDSLPLSKSYHDKF